MAKKPPQPEPEPEVRISIREVKENVEKRFNCFGTEECPDTIVPAGNKNTSPVAAEYFLADMLRKLADSRYKTAKQAAEEAGVLGTEDDYVENETVMTWQSPDFTINVKRGKPTKTLDRDQLTIALLTHVGDKKAKEIIEEAEKPRKGVTIVTTAMK